MAGLGAASSRKRRLRGAKHSHEDVNDRTSYWGSCPSGARGQQPLALASGPAWRLPPGRCCARPPAQHAFAAGQPQPPIASSTRQQFAQQRSAPAAGRAVEVLTGGSAAAAWRGSVDSTATNSPDLHLGSGRNELARRRAAHPTAAGAPQHGARLEGERGFQPSLRAASGTWQTAGAAPRL